MEDFDSLDRMQLRNYPWMFVDEDATFNGMIVVGRHSTANDVIAATDIAMDIQYALDELPVRIYVGAAYLDDQVEDVSAQNVISVGSACVNDVTAELLGSPADCHEGMEPGTAMVSLMPNGDNLALLVRGYESVDTRFAAAEMVTDSLCSAEGSEIVLRGEVDPEDPTPDTLSIGLISQEPTPVEQGQTLFVTVELENSGDEPASAMIAFEIPELGLTALPVWTTVEAESSATSGRLWVDVPVDTAIGSYTAVVTVISDAGEAVGFTDIEVVEMDNISPVAVGTVAPESGEAPLTITLDCTGSSDDDGVIESYDWSVSDGAGWNRLIHRGTMPDDVECELHEVVLEEVGEYAVTLTVTDDQGAEDTFETTVVVSEGETDPEDPEDPVDPDPESNNAPVPVIDVTPAEGVSPLNVSFDGSASFDHEGAIAAHSWIINGPEGFFYAELDVSGAPSLVELELVYVGDYTAQLIVMDEEGLSDVAEVTVTVTGEGSDPEDPEDPANEAPVPVLTITPASGETPLVVVLDGSASTDDGTIESFDWIVTGPDGFVVMDLNNSGVPTTKELTLDAAGTYAVTLVVTDDEGLAMSAEGTVVVTAPAGSDDDDDDSDDDSDDTSDEFPEISGKSVKDVTATSATIKWKTNDADSDSQVLYGTDEDDLDDDEEDSDEVESHEIELEDLEPQTKYYYTMISCNDAGCDEEGTFHFTTLMEDSGSSNNDNRDDDYYSNWDDLYAQNAGMIDDNPSVPKQQDVVVTTTQDQETGETVEIVYAQTQYMEVEEEVCKFRFLWWCLWKDIIVKRIPLPIMTSGIEFVV